MKVLWQDSALRDFQWWEKNNKFAAKKIKQLILSIKKLPFSGIGKPEPLKHELGGRWSRRITQEHRLVYKVEDDTLIIEQCRYHY